MGRKKTEYPYFSMYRDQYPVVQRLKGGEQALKACFEYFVNGTTPQLDDELKQVFCEMIVQKIDNAKAKNDRISQQNRENVYKRYKSQNSRKNSADKPSELQSFPLYADMWPYVRGMKDEEVLQALFGYFCGRSKPRLQNPLKQMFCESAVEKINTEIQHHQKVAKAHSHAHEETSNRTELYSNVPTSTESYQSVPTIQYSTCTRPVQEHNVTVQGTCTRQREEEKSSDRAECGQGDPPAIANAAGTLPASAVMTRENLRSIANKSHIRITSEGLTEFYEQVRSENGGTILKKGSLLWGLPVQTWGQALNGWLKKNPQYKVNLELPQKMRKEEPEDEEEQEEGQKEEQKEEKKEKFTKEYFAQPMPADPSHSIRDRVVWGIIFHTNSECRTNFPLDINNISGIADYIQTHWSKIQEIYTDEEIAFLRLTWCRDLT